MPLGEHRGRERLVTRQLERFLGIDDVAGKVTVREALAQLDEVAKVKLQEVEDSKVKDRS